MNLESSTILAQPETLEEKVARLEAENESLKAENAKLIEKNEILDEANKDLLEQVEDLSKKSYFDELTGLMSRRAFDEEMARRGPNILKKPTPKDRQEDQEEPENVVFVIFDIDHFKKVNDTRGHNAGDVVLYEVAQTIRQYVRRSDMVARWGGEEMVVAFDGATLDGAKWKANFIRQKVEALNFDEYPDLHVTISGGLANSTDFRDTESFFRAADSALYESKNNGRNQITVFSGD